MRFLVAESETEEDREARRARVGRSSGETYADTLRGMVAGARVAIVRPAEEGAGVADGLEGYDGVFLTGSPLHVYEDSPEVRRQVDFVRAVFGAGTPMFGSCAGLQVAVAAAGGTVRANRRGHECGFARRIVATAAGVGHPMLRGRPAVWDAATIHSDEVETLPEGATWLATNGVTRVQAAEVRFSGGVFWGVQYHPELPLEEVGAALRRQAGDLVEQGLARDEAAVGTYAGLVEGLGREPGRRDLAWRLGVDGQVADEGLRQTELRNFVDVMVRAVRARRGR